jgi:hypothetical protein
MSWFNFVKRTDNVGVGTMDLGLLKIGRSVVPVSILGTNGLAVPDQMTLQQLAYQERQRG